MDAPPILDVRLAKDRAADPRLLPANPLHNHADLADWASDYVCRHVVVLCQGGMKLSQGTAAWLRHVGARAEVSEGGFQAWTAAGLPLLRAHRGPPHDRLGRTVWVTRARPKIDRIARPWLVRRFVDPVAVFLFVAPSEVSTVGDRFSATPFDVEGVAWSHRGPLCTFDIMLQEWGGRRSRCSGWR
uniref:chromate resistance protein ChrB domain-containing protein n=1 Tax=Dankookia rubra TaxID=1442381 RepID=UPI00240CFEEA|nr:chromate resistance protein ChrB domain-containing protein [Dankookia rubra]